ncbi:MAG: Hint domain-containing protein, partial [Longimicrobiales bacterium]
TSPPVAGNLSPTRLKYRLDDRYVVFYCDPDHYPVSRGDEGERALEQFPSIAADAEKYEAILEHLGLSVDTEPTTPQKLSIYREDKRLAAIVLEQDRTAYAFELRASEASDRVVTIRGEIDRAGRIRVRQRSATLATCPICLDGETLIAGATAEVPVSALREGDLVWSLDTRGARVLVPVIETRRVPLVARHHFVRLRLTDGRELLASPGHPLGDGRRLGDLAAGDQVDTVIVHAADRVTAAAAATYDVLPAGSTGVYWASGILMLSTMR